MFDDNMQPDDGLQDEYRYATVKTANDLRTIAQNLAQEQISQLTIPELDNYVEVVSKVIPAGNVPGLILSGLSRLQNPPSEDDARRDVGRIFRGVGQLLDKAVYTGFFAGPAAVIWGYQKLLQLAGKSPETAFPEGTWQFYVDYALREDTAHHTNETHGFDTALQQNDITLSEVDRITAWVMTAIETLHNYDDLLANEWRERMYTRAIREVDDSTMHQRRYKTLYQRWQEVIPYRRKVDARGDESYADYRKRKFDEFLFPHIRQLGGAKMFKWQQTIQQYKQQYLAVYQRQMSIVSTLFPDKYSELRVPMDVKEVAVGIIYHGRYYFIPICEPDSDEPATLERIRGLIAAMVVSPSPFPATDLTVLARVKRSEILKLVSTLPEDLQTELSYFRRAPIVINTDVQNRQQPLADLRLAERGTGDHPLTIFDTRRTFVFDMSHIYFDGGWGAALAEIMTNEAVNWANTLHQLKRAEPASHRPYSPELRINVPTRIEIQKSPSAMSEVSAETDKVRLDFMLELRKLFKQRNDLLNFSVNDILVLYRAIHAVTYEPDATLVAELEALIENESTREAATLALDAVKPYEQSPAILIPVDASLNQPRDRVYPMSFQVPLDDLNLLELHRQTVDALKAYKNAAYEHKTMLRRFDRLQREYLGALGGFGAVMQRAKDIANAGESASVSTIKLLAHLPPALQQVLDEIPGRFDMLNDIIKGREVFSNVGRVADSSSLRRFLTAKDDNKQKALAWGVITDARDTMRISLRDFRPHVEALLALDRRDLCNRIVRHYLDSYATGLNQYITDLQRITQTTSEVVSVQTDKFGTKRV